MGNYPMTPCGSIKLQKLEHPLRYSGVQTKRGVGLQLHLFCGAEFLERGMFDNVELERSCPKYPFNAQIQDKWIKQ
jgi:hypothetical protein